MDRKSLIVVGLSFLLLVGWFPLMNKLYPPKPRVASTNLVTQASNQLSVATLGNNTNLSSTAIAPTISGPEALLVVTNDSLIYTFTSRGGGIQKIDLTNHQALILCGRKDAAFTNRPASLNQYVPTPIMAFLGGETLAGDGHYELTRTEKGIRAEKVLTNGLAVVKDFTFGTNYLVTAKTSIENKGSAPVAIPEHEVVIGTATPVNHLDLGLYVGVFWYNGKKAEHITESWFQNTTLGCAFGASPRSTYQGGANNVEWAAIHNQFFTIAALPSEKAPQVVSRQVNVTLPPELAAEALRKKIKQQFGYQTGFLYPSAALNPGQSIQRTFQIYAGPKEYKTLATFGHQMKNDLDAVMDFGFFGMVAKALLLSMNTLHSKGLHYGMAIIVITVIIKLLFWPLTNASTKSMKRLQLLQPQMAAIKEKYKDDPAKVNQKTMEFMKENKVNPLGGCLPLLLQFPVFIGFYTMLNSAIELRGVSFLWACDLSQADTIAFIAGFPINPLPMIYGVTLLWSANLTPPSPGMDPAQQKMMKYMPVIFLFILYNMAAGLTLYWTVQNLLSILQTKVTKASTDKTVATPPTKTGPPVKGAHPQKKKK
jgi:YidC/Oxa1 family membrane protein insertase